jgi:hypothetical protein
MQAALKAVSATLAAVDDDAVLVAPTQYMQQLKLLIQVTVHDEHLPDAPGCAEPAVAATGYHGRGATTAEWCPVCMPISAPCSRETERECRSPRRRWRDCSRV